MKTRDILALVGGCLVPVGAALMTFSPGTASWVIGFALTGVGPVLMGASRLARDPQLPPPTTTDSAPVAATKPSSK